MSPTIETLAIVTRCPAEALASDDVTLAALRANEQTPLPNPQELGVSARVIGDGSILFTPLPFAIGIRQVPAILASVVEDPRPLESDERGVFVYPVLADSPSDGNQYDEVIESQGERGRWIHWQSSKLGRVFCSSTQASGDSQIAASGSSPSEDGVDGSASEPASPDETDSPDPLAAFIEALSPDSAAPPMKMGAVMDLLTEAISQATGAPAADPAELLQAAQQREEELTQMLESVDTSALEMPADIGELLGKLMPRPI